MVDFDEKIPIYLQIMDLIKKRNRGKIVFSEE